MRLLISMSILGACGYLTIPSVPALSQGLYVAPAWTEFEQLDFLTGAKNTGQLAVSADVRLWYDTNVEDFAVVGVRHPAHSVFNGSLGYYTSDQSQDISLSKGPWQIQYDSSTAELYRGNKDAAQLYLDIKSNTVNTNGVYNPNMTLNRSATDRISLTYSSPLRAAKLPTIVRLTSSYLSIGRAQMGTLNGATVNGQFNGTIDLNTTLGLPSGQIDSQGYALDAGASVAVSRRIRASAFVENLLSHVWQRHVQHITANVVTNTLVPDPNGFLQVAPLLSGQVTQTALDSGLQRRYYLGMTYSESGRDWIALLTHDFDCRTQIGLNARLSRSQRCWLLLSPQPFEWQVGYRYRGFRFEFGLSSIDLGTSRRAVVQIGYTYKH